MCKNTTENTLLNSFSVGHVKVYRKNKRIHKMNTSINYATLLCNLAPIYRMLSVYDVVKSEDDARENSSEIGSIRVVRRRPYR